MSISQTNITDAISPPAKRKRKRTDCKNLKPKPDIETIPLVTCNNEAALKRSAIWFEDGNDILQAEHIQFRVHKGILARHSKVFCDMFTLPQGTGEVLVNGCSMIPLSDSPLDWNRVLTVLYDSVKGNKSIKKFCTDTLVAILRLGHKYKFKELRDAARNRIKRELPTTLLEWEQKAYPHKRNLKNPHQIHGHEFKILNVLLEVKIQSLLPAAYYACLHYQSMHAIFQGRPDHKAATVPYLSYDSQTTLVIGAEKIRDGIRRHLVSWVNDGSLLHGGCLDPGQCSGSRTNTLETYFFKAPISMAFEPSVGKVSAQYCKTCSVIIEQSYETGRQQIWKELPSYFGLPKWEDLKDF